MTFPYTFQLSVQRIEHRCTFELSGSSVPRQTCQLDYPSELDRLYQAWQEAYLGYYQQLRGEKITSGQIASAPIPEDGDYRTQLVEAEVRLLNTFHRWLQSAELYDIRTTIAKAAQAATAATAWVNVCLRCAPADLARLPWETWEIGEELGVPRRVRISREPQNIRHDVTRPIRRRARILAIVGDDTGVDLETDIVAIHGLNPVAQVEFFHCQTDGEPSGLLRQISQKIADPVGWDILFFIGHSNESPLTGGEIRVASNVAVSIKDLAPSLQTAKQRGLQFAVFNSCEGLNLAESLIDLGLSQVAVMREPIHDRVAHLFIKQFLTSLANYKDVHTSLLDACAYLKQQENELAYPSAYWIPSLFRHPDAELFRIQPFGWRHRLRRRLPTRGEAITLSVCTLASLLPLCQDLLLEGRLFAQALNRQLTGDIPAQVEAPILLVQIDPPSLAAAEITNPRPIPQDYLAEILNAATDRNAAIVGIDYLLDDAETLPSPEQRAQLKQAIAQADQTETQIVFAYDQSERAEYTSEGFVSDELVDFAQARHGDINFYPSLLDLPGSGVTCGSLDEICPFSYELARPYDQSSLPENAAPIERQQAMNSADVFGKPSVSLSQPTEPTAPRNLFGITSFSESFLQAWFHPVVDFSLPPDRAYRTISACELLQQCPGDGNTLTDLSGITVLIASGGYDAAGIDLSDSDNFPVPAALSVWERESFTGGEVHAYMLHHLLTDYRVYPIPDLWMILLIAIVAKELRLRVPHNAQRRQEWTIAIALASVAYSVISLQIFRAAGLIVPIFLPVTVLWLYVYLAYRSGSGNRRIISSYRPSNFEFDARSV